MATLVLTAVGTAIGGPVGGAIGALLGQSVDAATLFRPKRREGPRLAELAVQTSSYGTQIPKLFGTMRVAGTVIWATDLIEDRTRSGGSKGQPGVTTYTYSASFAVSLSARPIKAIGRIWAEGKLLRGAAGDFKVKTGFRLHLGGEDQPVDPLIASAEGLALTPAHRGCAYAVFEQLPLADYGNRIPSLTFEVIADDGAVTVGTIAAAVSDRVDGIAAFALDGFAAAGGSVRAVLDTLAGVSGAGFAPVGARLAMRDPGAATRTIADAGVAADGKGARGARSIRPIATTARSIAVAHYDPARDYQSGLQRARRPGAGERDERIDVPAVIGAGMAKTVAMAMLARAEAARTQRTVTIGFEGFGIAPGDCVAIAGETGRWRVSDVAIEAMVATLRLTPVEPATLPARATAGRPIGAADVASGATIVAAFETPALDAAVLAGPRLSIAAAGRGAGWRRATLLYSLDEGRRWIEAGTTAAPAVIGRVDMVAAPAPATLVDLASAFEVTLANDAMALADADDDALDRGANLAAIGGELVQFGRATPLSARRWRLERLWRGRRGTDGSGQTVGDRFVLLDAATVATIDLPASSIGSVVRVMATGVEDDEPATDAAAITGRSVVPPAPVRLTAETRADGAAIIRWVRRSRAGWRWLDGVDVPIGEEREAYRVTIGDGGAGTVIDVAMPSAVVPAGAIVPGVIVAVRQRGTVGESAAATIIHSEGASA